MDTLREYEASNPNTFDSMIVTRKEGESYHRGEITIPSAKRTYREQKDATIAMSKSNMRKTKPAWSKSQVSAELTVDKASVLPSEDVLEPWLSGLGATYQELEQGQEAEVPTVATLHPATGSFVDILERAFGREKGQATEVITDFLDERSLVYYHRGQAKSAEYQDELLLKTISAVPAGEEERAKSWSIGGAGRVENNVFRTVAQQPGTLRWTTENGEEHKRVVLYNVFECDSASVYR
jgi:hypothetical protein